LYQKWEMLPYLQCFQVQRYLFYIS
jgi:hypothetical protein